MPLYREFKFGNATVAVWKITETSEELLSMLPDEYAACSVGLCNGQRRAEWLAVRILLAGLCGTCARIVYDGNGKPLLEGATGYISISHTKGYALLAYSVEEPIGIDVELLARDVSFAACRFVNDEYLASLPGKECNVYVLAYWCLCEALFKLVGNVGGTYKENVYVKPYAMEAQGTIEVSLKGTSVASDTDYCASYVNDGELLIVLIPGR